MKANKRLRILHVLNSLEPGGLENGVVNVANRLRDEEFDVHFCCLENGGEFVKRLRHPENVVELRRSPGFSMRTVSRLATTIRNLNPDVIHSHNLAPPHLFRARHGFRRLETVVAGGTRHLSRRTGFARPHPFSTAALPRLRPGSDGFGRPAQLDH